MNDGQNKFFNFIIERVKLDKIDFVKSLLSESFEKLNTHNFDTEYALKFKNELLPCLKEDSVDEVIKILSNFNPSNH